VRLRNKYSYIDLSFVVVSWTVRLLLLFPLVHLFSNETELVAVFCDGVNKINVEIYRHENAAGL